MERQGTPTERRRNADGTPNDGTPNDGTPNDGTPNDGTPNDGTPMTERRRRSAVLINSKPVVKS
jgi:hypothetical protein